MIFITLQIEYKAIYKKYEHSTTYLKRLNVRRRLVHFFFLHSYVYCGDIVYFLLPSIYCLLLIFYCLLSTFYFLVFNLYCLAPGD